MTNEEKVDSMLKFFHGKRTLGDLLLEMAEWKDQQFEDMKEKIKVDTKIEVGYELREKISNGASIMSLDTYARHLCNL